MDPLFKSYIRWADDTVELVLSRKLDRDVNPEEEVRPIVDSLVARVIGNREEIDTETVDQLCDSVVLWAYSELRDTIKPEDNRQYKKNKSPLPKRCLIEVRTTEEDEDVIVSNSKSGHEWPTDEYGELMSPDDKSIVVDGSEYDRIIVVR